MLTLTASQIRAFSEASRAGLAGRLADRLAPFFPVQVRFSGMATLHAAAEEVLTRAEADGCRSEQEAAKYLLLCWLAGIDFADDPRLPWAAGWPGAQRAQGMGTALDRQLAQINALLDRVQGPDNGRMVRAMVRVRRLGDDDFAAAGTDPARCADWLATVLQGWAAEEDGAVLRRVAEAAPALAARLSLEGPADTAIVALHATLLGQGFAADPLYPWAADALSRAGPDRAQALFAMSCRYIEAILR